MIIHTVARGENLLTIAKKYAVSPAKIIEHNGLTCPDYLLPGQKLLIFIPTRSYTVRGGDTAAKLCKRFEIRKSALLANNPCLKGKTALRAGTELAIRYDAPKYGFAVLNGYIYEGIDAERFYTLLPYMTYLTFCTESGEFEDFLEDARGQNKIPLLRLRWERIAKSGEIAENFEKTILEIKNRGFRGIALPPQENEDEKTEKMLLEIKKLLLGKDMLLFCEMEAEAKEERFDAADGLVVLYEKCHKKEIPTFALGEKQALEGFAEKYDAVKSFLEISAFGYDGKNALDMEQIRKIAIKYKAEYNYDEEKKVSYLDYNQFFCGKKEALRIHFEAPENIKAKLALMHELGFMGAALDMGRAPISTVMMLYTSFCGIECPYTGIFNC